MSNYFNTAYNNTMAAHDYICGPRSPGAYDRITGLALHDQAVQEYWDDPPMFGGNNGANGAARAAAAAWQAEWDRQHEALWQHRAWVRALLAPGPVGVAPRDVEWVDPVVEEVNATEEDELVRVARMKEEMGVVEDEGGASCPCGRYDAYEDMVLCSTEGHTWWHLGCGGFDVRVVMKDEDDWFCPLCVSRGEDDDDDDDDDGDDEDLPAPTLPPASPSAASSPGASPHPASPAASPAPPSSASPSPPPSPLRAAPPPSPAPTLTPAPTPKKKNGAWTPAEAAAAISIMKAVHVPGADGKLPRAETLWKEISSRLARDHGMQRSAAAVKNEWSRELRAASGYDERVVKRPEQMRTGLLTKKGSAARGEGGKKAQPQPPPPPPPPIRKGKGRKRVLVVDSDSDDDDDDTPPPPPKKRRVAPPPTDDYDEGEGSAVGAGPVMTREEQLAADEKLARELDAEVNGRRRR
ncbi:hypothetical protein B0A49_02039 [Cryomyces minteri]|uniref:Myb-like domain-containing protein n=1 Tax=Cryomyces minteri TaxID=331657 RepID=A0A4U0XV65_9PEZI|nr:hypothetical protein B0A49_02039 [Cryomyces minteri]